MESKRERVLITGGAGFVGSHVVEHFVKNRDWDIVVVDKLSYASHGFKRLKHMGVYDKIQMITWDISIPFSVGLYDELGQFDYIFHIAAMSDVNGSISNPRDCIRNNVMSTVEMLELARRQTNLKTFFMFSTDEVYGPASLTDNFTEKDLHNPSNPYSASKSSSEMIALSYANTYNIPIITTHCMNIFGELQHCEKFIPLCVKRILDGKNILIHTYSDKKTPGSRHYVHARNVANVLLYLTKHGKIGEMYNIGGQKELNNLEVAQRISKIMGLDLKYQLVDFHKDRPGHDTRYALDDSKLKESGFKFESDFEDSFRKTVLWMADIKNKEWLDN